MGLRVGDSEKGLSGPGDGLTLASLKEAAATPVSAKPPVMRTPASAPAAQPPAQSANVFDSMASSNVGTGESQGGAAQGGAPPAPHPNGPPPESFAEKAYAAAKAGYAGAKMTMNASFPGAGEAMDFAAHHGEMAGAIVGDIAGAASPVPGGAAIGSGVGAAAGQKLERFVKGEPQPSALESVKTAGAMSAMSLAGSYTLSPILKGMGGKLAEAGKSAYDATSPAIEAAGQTVRNGAKDLLQYAGDKFSLFKSELIGGTPAAATAEADLKNVAQNGTEAAKQQLSLIMQQRESAIFHNMSVLHTILPKPVEGEAFDPAGFVSGWVERHGQQVQNYKSQISDLIGDHKADVTGMLDGIGAHLRKNLVIDESGKILPSAGKDQKFLANFYTDMMKLTRQPAPAKTGFDSAWDLISQQEWKGAVAETPVATVSFGKDAAAGGRMLSMDDFNVLMRRVQKEAVEQGGTMLPGISKDMTNRYYSMMGDMAKKAGREDIASGLVKANAEYSSLVDFAGDMSRQIEKNPTAAVNVMVNKNNPTATAMMMRLLTPNQQAMMSRAFLSSAVQDAFDANTGAFNAKDVLQQIVSHGDKNLAIMFGGEKGTVVGALNKLATLQKTNLSYGAQENIVADLAKDASKSSTVKGLIRTAVDWYKGKSANVGDLLGSQEFADKVYRMQSGLQTAGQKRMTAIGKGIQSSAGTVSRAPLAVAASLGSKISDQNARRQMDDEANPFNQ